MTHIGLTTASFLTVMLISSPVSAQSANDFSAIARNITQSVERLPGLVSAVSYLIGLLMGVQGVLKLKDHVESPVDQSLSGAAIPLLAGGSLFALPIIFEAMANTIGITSGAMGAPTLSAASFNVR